MCDREHASEMVSFFWVCMCECVLSPGVSDVCVPEHPESVCAECECGQEAAGGGPGALPPGGRAGSGRPGALEGAGGGGRHAGVHGHAPQGHAP